MSKEIALVNFNEDQINLIKSQIAPKATDSELQLFLYQAKRTGLDPLTRQIYAIHRNVKEKEFGKDVWKQKMSIQTSIDGFRVIAERSGDYAGQDEPIFTEEGNKLISCKVAVYRFRNDMRYPAAVGVAYWSEYVQTDNEGRPSGLWKTMPHTMLAKVAEALALRKAYPQDLSGLYTSDEMNQADEIKIVNEMQSPLDNPTVMEALGAKRNAFGLKAGTALTDGSAMQETQEEENKKQFARIKDLIENVGSSAELQGIWFDNAKQINSLKKYATALYDLLVEAKDTMKAQFIGE